MHDGAATRFDTWARQTAVPVRGAAVDVTNGIAQIPGTDRYLVTGKWWPTMYEVRFTAA